MVCLQTTILHFIAFTNKITEVKDNYYEELNCMKSVVAKLIVEKFPMSVHLYHSLDVLLILCLLDLSAASKPVSRINYKNFSQMMNCFAIVCKNWPLEQFYCPGSINSMPEFTVLKITFESGAARFCKRNAKEVDEWR